MTDLGPDDADALQREVYELADAQLHQTITAEDTRRLGELVRNHADARRHYVRFMHDSAKLCQWSSAWNQENTERESRLGVAGNVIPGELRATVSLAGAPSIHPSPSILHHAHLLPQLLGSATLGYAIAVLIFAAGILAAWAWRMPRNLETGPVDSNIAAAVKPGEIVGVVTAVADCRWADRVTAAALGAPVLVGRKFALASGVLEITYTTGTEVILLGPAVYEVKSASGGLLSFGRLTARVESRGEGEGGKSSEFRGQDLGFGVQGSGPANHPSSLISHPSSFVLESPAGAVTSVAGEFGVDAGSSGIAQTHVFRGKVELQWAGRDGAVRAVALEEGRSARFEHVGATRVATLIADAALPNVFARRMLRGALPKAFRGDERFAGVWLKAIGSGPNRQLIAVGSGERPMASPAAPNGAADVAAGPPPVLESRRSPDGVTYTVRSTIPVMDMALPTAVVRLQFITHGTISAIRFNGENVPGIRALDRKAGEAGVLLVGNGVVQRINVLEVDFVETSLPASETDVRLKMRVQVGGISLPSPQIIEEKK